MRALHRYVVAMRLLEPRASRNDTCSPRRPVSWPSSTRAFPLALEGSMTSTATTVHSATLLGVDGHAVRVEVHISNGIPGFTVVGSPDSVCREARDRVRAALISSGCNWPRRRTTVNLAPSGLRKGGSALDLAIAVGIAVADPDAEEPMDVALHEFAFVGELGLDGSVRTVPGTLPMVDAIEQQT